ncbi:MAG: PilZ domain-containing protein [Deltaproteobacteria bacterium]|nr:PilZ domain-containing protein [Deltaproteobacteria bacterium]
MGAIEQRQADRFDVEVAAEVYTTNAVLPANTRNLSNTGVCLDLTDGLEEGSVVGVSLFFTSDGIEDPDGEPLNLKANVIWCTERDDSGYSVGAHFTELTPENITELEGFLSALGG